MIITTYLWEKRNLLIVVKFSKCVSFYIRKLNFVLVLFTGIMFPSLCIQHGS